MGKNIAIIALVTILAGVGLYMYQQEQDKATISIGEHEISIQAD